MKTAVIGCGNISRCHFSAIEKLEGVDILAAVDIKKERAENAAEKYNCRAYTDHIEMLEKEKPDCVHICTPHYLHAQMAVDALSRNINVLCEKPCAISRSDLFKIKAALEKSTATFGVCFQNRYNESVRAVKEVLESGGVGDIVCARAIVHWRRDREYYSDDWHGKKEKEGGGVLINQAIHTLDLLRCLLGEDMVYVTGHIFNEKFKDIEVEDTVSARFETANAIIAVFNATVGAGCDHSVIIDIVCEKATLRIEGNSAYLMENGRTKTLFAEENHDFIGKDYWGKSHKVLIEDFYKCVSENRRFPIDFCEASKSIRELLAVYASSESGKRVKI